MDMATEAGSGRGGEGAFVEPDGGAAVVWRIRGEGFDGFAGPGSPVAGVGAGAFGEIGETKQEFAAGVGAEAVDVVLLEFKGLGIVAEGELDEGAGHFGGHAAGGCGKSSATGDPDADVVGGQGNGTIHESEGVGPERDAVLDVAFLEELTGLKGFAGAEPDEGFGVVGIGLQGCGGGSESAGEGGFVAGESGEDVVADLKVEAGGGVLGVGAGGGADAQQEGKGGSEEEKLAFHEDSLALCGVFRGRIRMNRRIRRRIVEERG